MAFPIVGVAVSAVGATLGAFLLQAAGSLAARVLVSLGIGIAAAKVGAIGFEQIKQYFDTAQNGFPPKILDIMAIWGISSALNIMIFAISFYFSMKTAHKALKFFSTK